MIAETKKSQSAVNCNLHLNETLRIIYSRRAVRQYTDKPVDRKVIELIIDAGRMAPSAMNNQPWRFYVLTGREIIRNFSKQIGKASIHGISQMGVKRIARSVASALFHPADLRFFKGDDFIFHGAPVVIFITAPKEYEWAGLDIGACAQNMMLAAKALGLDSCPVGLAKFVADTAIFSTLNVPEKDQVLLSVIIGYADESPGMHERKRDNLIFIG